MSTASTASASVRALLRKARARDPAATWTLEEIDRAHGVAKHFLAWYAGTCLGALGAGGWRLAAYAVMFVNGVGCWLVSRGAGIDAEAHAEAQRFALTSGGSSAATLACAWSGTAAALAWAHPYASRLLEGF